MRNFKRGKDLSPMNKLKELREQKLDNKGFSLVELIIVIAIMAVLIGVLAPQYLKYVEKSRKSADLDTLDGMISAVEIFSADPANSIVDGTLTCDADGDISADDAVLKALKDAGIAKSTATAGDTLTSVKSTTYKHAWTINFDENGVQVNDSDPASTLAADLGRN